MQDLFDSFSPSEISEWKKLTEKELKGADINNLPLWKDSDGFSAKPAYFKTETEKLPMFGQTVRPLRFNQKNNDWLICANIKIENMELANTEILHKAALGASAFSIDLNGHDLARDDFDVLFKDVRLEAVAISFSNAYNTIRFQADYYEWAKRRGYVADSLMGGFWFDQINADLASALIINNDQHAFGAVGLDCGQFYMKGATIPHQLGSALAWGNELVNGLRKAGVSFEDISNNIGFSMAVGGSFLPEIAKFRLIRFLWARIMQQHGAANKRWKTWVHAQTGERHQSSMDTPVNLLRENTQAMSAVLGGVDSLTIHPFRKDQPELADRMAINTHHLMKEEARLNQVIDPAAGSYYVEHLTEIIGTHAWEFFLQIENEGGYSACVTNRFLDKVFAKTDEAYYAEVEKVERVLVGSNKYPSPFTESNDKA